MSDLQLTYQTIIESSVVLSGAQLRQLLEGLSADEFTEFVNNKLDVLVPNTPFFKDDLFGKMQQLCNEREIHSEFLLPTAIYLTNRFLIDEGMCVSDYAMNVFTDDFTQHLEEYLDTIHPEVIAITERVATLTETECQQLLRDANIETEDDIDSLEETELQEVVLNNYFAGKLTAEVILKVSLLSQYEVWARPPYEDTPEVYWVGQAETDSDAIAQAKEVAPRPDLIEVHAVVAEN